MRLGIAGFPVAWATCPANTAALLWAKIATPALPEPLVYSQTMPPPGVDVVIGPPYVAPRAVFAGARVGQVAAVFVADDADVTAVVVLTAGAAVVDGEVVVVDELLLDPHAPRTRPVISAPTARNPPVLMVQA